MGLPVSGTPDPDVFSSALLSADARLDTFAFGGPDVCVPCFADGSTGIPVRRDAGTLTQGMRGSLPVSAPVAAGEVRAPLSADGAHLVFGSTEKLEPAGNNGALSIYDRNLDSGGTQVVSTLPDGTTMSGEVAELGISNDGSRIVVGRFVGKDDAGNKLYDLFMHRDGDPFSVAIADTPHGASYGGMTGDGGTVYFTTVDPVSGDSDTGADLYRARIGSGPAEVARVSSGTGSTGDTNACTPAAGWNDVDGASDCSVLMVSGTGGIAEQSGLAAFLSPELLDGGSHGVAGEPNLYTVAADGSPAFVATLATTDPLVLHAREDTAPRYTADFQITPSGRYAVFTSRRPITNYPTNGHQEIYRYDAVGGELICVSCASTGARAESDASMPAAGGALSDEGTVFFTTRDPLNLRDLNDKTDIYESTPQGARLVSTGINEFDSALLSASRDGKDVFFFTHDVLYSGDENGNLVKIYDARQGGGFYVPQTLPPCRASDECHGPSSESPPPPDIGTYRGVGGQLTPVMATKPKRCKRGQVRRHGRCVRKAAVKQRTKKKGGETMRANFAIGGSARWSTLVGALLIVLLSSLAVMASKASATATISSFRGGHVRLEGRDHPDLETNVTIQDAGAPESIRNAVVNLPEGMFGNPNAVPKCTSADFALFRCAPISQAGIVTVRGNYEGIGDNLMGTAPLYVLESRSETEATRFGFIVPQLNVPISIPVSLRTASDYGVRLTVSEVTQQIPLAGYNMTIWGFPAKGEHDESRFAIGEPGKPANCPASSESTCTGPHFAPIPVKPLTSNPSVCTGKPLTVTLDVSTYQDPGHLAHADDTYPETTDCETADLSPGLQRRRDEPQLRLPGRPRDSAQSAAAPVLFRFSFPDPVGDAALARRPDHQPRRRRRAGHCTDAEANFGTEGPADCPDLEDRHLRASTPPALDGPLIGSLYIGEPKPGDQYRLFMIASGFGINAKLVGLRPSRPGHRPAHDVVRRPSPGPLRSLPAPSLRLRPGPDGDADPLHDLRRDSTFFPWNGPVATADVAADLISLESGPRRHGPAPG